MHARYKASFSSDLALYLEQREFYAISEDRFLEALYQSCTGRNPKFSINFGKFQHC